MKDRRPHSRIGRVLIGALMVFAGFVIILYGYLLITR